MEATALGSKRILESAAEAKSPQRIPGSIVAQESQPAAGQVSGIAG